MPGRCWRPVLSPYRFSFLSRRAQSRRPAHPPRHHFVTVSAWNQRTFFVQNAHFPKLLDNCLTNNVEAPMMSITQGWQLVNIFMRFFGIKFRLMENRENFPAALPSYSGLSPPISRPPAAEKRFMIRKETKHGQETRCHGR